MSFFLFTFESASQNTLNPNGHDMPNVKTPCTRVGDDSFHFDLEHSSDDEAPKNPRALSRQRAFYGSAAFAQLHNPNHHPSSQSLFGLGQDGPKRRDFGNKRTWDDERHDHQHDDIPELTPRITKKIRRCIALAAASRMSRIEREQEAQRQSATQRQSVYVGSRLARGGPRRRRRLYVTSSQIDEARMNYYSRRINGGYRLD